MAVTNMWSFDQRSTLGFSLNATASVSTTQARTGVASLRINPASGAGGTFLLGLVSGYIHFGLYIATLPSVARVIAGDPGVGSGNLLLNTDGSISVRNNTTVTGTSTALATNRWYWIGWRNQATVTGVLLQIDAVDQVSGTTGAQVSGTLGCGQAEASAIDIYFDDVVIDGAGFLNPSRVALALPISDVSRTDWTNDAAGTTLWSAIDNAPPTGIADTTAGSGLHQVRDATNGNDTFVVNLATYTTLGIVSTDKVLAVQPIAYTGAPVSTSAKSGSLTVTNPTINKATIGTFYDDFDSVNAGTFPTGWKRSTLAVATSPTVTLGTSPTITVTQDTSSTRIAMMTLLGMEVVWTPGALGKITNVGQAVARAANY